MNEDETRVDKVLEEKALAFAVFPKDKLNITRVQYHPRFSSICSVSGVPFGGTLDIEYFPGEYLLEFESFERYLKEISKEPTTIEGFACRVLDALHHALGDTTIKVCVHATTPVHAPATVEVWHHEDIF